MITLEEWNEKARNGKEYYEVCVNGAVCCKIVTIEVPRYGACLDHIYGYVKQDGKIRPVILDISLSMYGDKHIDISYAEDCFFSYQEAKTEESKRELARQKEEIQKYKNVIAEAKRKVKVLEMSLEAGSLKGRDLKEAKK